MTAVQLMLPDWRLSGVWFCGLCRTVHPTEDLANSCCAPRVCRTCGASIQSTYKTICDGCFRESLVKRDREMFIAAEKIREEDGTGMLYLEEGRSGYYESSDELIQACEESGIEPPSYAWLCEKRHFVKVSLDRILEDIAEDGYEDFDTDNLKGVPELEAAIGKFEEANHDTYAWAPNFKKAVDFSL